MTAEQTSLTIFRETTQINNDDTIILRPIRLIDDYYAQLVNNNKYQPFSKSECTNVLVR